MSLPESVLRARLLAHNEPTSLDLVTTANPGREVSVEGLLVHDPEHGSFWLVTHDDAMPLDDFLWAAFHEDPAEDIVGRVRVTLEAA